MTTAYLTQSEAKRFWPRVEQAGQCLVWTGPKFSNGYGAYCFRGKTVRAHRIAWSVASGKDVPDGMVVMHLCDNPLCVRPDHLSTGTNADNVADRNAKGRQAKGAASPLAKLSADLVRDIRSSKEGARAIARRLGVSRTAIQRVRQGLAWSHVE